MRWLCPGLLLTIALLTIPGGSAGAQSPPWWNTLERVSGTSAPIAAGQTASFQVDCPPGKRVVHGGGSVPVSAAIVQNGPLFSPPTSWTVRAKWIQAPVANWTIAAFVWCADIPDLEVVSQISAISVAGFHTASATCPPGKHLVGGGGAAFPAGDDTVSLLESFPSDVDTWVATGTRIGTIDNAWFASASALCSSTGPPDLSSTTIASDATSLAATSRCSDDATILGLGHRLAATSENLALRSNLDLQTTPPSWRVRIEETNVFNGLGLELIPLCWSQVLFRSGFESGDTESWSDSAP